jgi:hypothetical protein
LCANEHVACRTPWLFFSVAMIVIRLKTP